jgi:hypothetical protein
MAGEKDVSMLIDPAGKPSPPAPPSRARRAQSGFILPQEGDENALGAAPAEAAAPAAGTAPVELPPIDPPAADPAHEAEAAVHGDAILKAMSDIQLALLDGGGGGAACRTLASLADSLPSVADPDLRSVLQSVAVRAAVVLARGQ